MLIRIITSMLMLFVVFMGVKQGIGMVSGKPETIAVFQRAGFSPMGEMMFGVLTITSALFILIPQGYLLGNILMAASILAITCLQLSVKDIKLATLELPFLLLNLLLIYFQYPLTEKK